MFLYFKNDSYVGMHICGQNLKRLIRGNTQDLQYFVICTRYPKFQYIQITVIFRELKTHFSNLFFFYQSQAIHVTTGQYSGSFFFTLVYSYPYQISVL